MQRCVDEVEKRSRAHAKSIREDMWLYPGDRQTVLGGGDGMGEDGHCYAVLNVEKEREQDGSCKLRLEFEFAERAVAKLEAADRDEREKRG